MVMLLGSIVLCTCDVLMCGFEYGIDEAMEILEETKKDYKLIIPFFYHTIICGYCKLQPIDEALKILTKMKDCGVSHTNIDEYESWFSLFSRRL